jgi:hypothetical protein
MDVDLLERELYAMKKSTDDFVEIPMWARLWTNAFWYGGPRPSRRQAQILEALCMGFGVLFLTASFFIPAALVVTVFRVAGCFSLVVGYGLSVAIRMADTYRLWPPTEISVWDWRPKRTIRKAVFDYTFVVVVLIVFFGAVSLLAN